MGLDQVIIDRISAEASVSSRQVLATIGLLENEATVPFIARYRKEVTGNLNEVQIRVISQRQDYYRSFLERRESVLKSIEEQGKLTDELKQKILSCYERATLEDLYLPYKPKKKTKASIAIEKGLEPLASYLRGQTISDKSIEEIADAYINPEKGVNTRDEALEGALHIVAEWISEDLEIRQGIRGMFLKEGMVISKVNKDKADQKTKFEMYYDFREPVAKIPSHRVLAVRRGVKEQVLNYNIDIDREKATQTAISHLVKDQDSPFNCFLQTAIKDSYDRLLNPSLQGEVRAFLKDRSDQEAIKVFEENLTNLLLSPPAGPIAVMGIDPGFRTGCKVAVVDKTGKFLEHATIYPTEPKIDIAGSEKTLYYLVQKHGVQAIAIGNGTGSRETDSFVRQFLRKYKNGEPFDIPSVPRDKKEIELNEPEKETLSPGDSTGVGSVETTLTELARTSEASGNSLSHSVEMVSLSGIDGIGMARSEVHELDSPIYPIVSAEADRKPGNDEATGNDAIAEAVENVSDFERKHALDIPSEERHDIFSVIVNESGASVYSASDSARREFPTLDLTVRGAISIARRLQDPLAELVKIHPKSIGVGQYQHDVDQKRLKEGLEAAVESCVNRVGVDLNTASYELLRYCSGINQRTAKSIIDCRNGQGPFVNRSQLMQVQGFGEKTFEQAAGFLRIKGGDNPLDSTAVHPESYWVVEKMAQSLGVAVGQLIENSRVVENLDLQQFVDDKIGIFTLADIKLELLKPGRDPRDKFIVPVFRDDVKDVADLHIGMVLEGSVTNVTNFGAFVDIGVHQDGLVHVSELSSRFVRDPRDAVHVGEIVKVKVIGVDVAMKRISLSIKALLPERQKEKPVYKRRVARPSKPSQPQRMIAAVAEAGANSKPPQKVPPPSTAIAKAKLGRRSSPGGKEQVAKNFTNPQRKAEAKGVAGKKIEPQKHDSSPAFSSLPFDEQIRLLQEKFSGIR